MLKGPRPRTPPRKGGIYVRDEQALVIAQLANIQTEDDEVVHATGLGRQIGPLLLEGRGDSSAGSDGTAPSRWAGLNVQYPQAAAVTRKTWMSRWDSDPRIQEWSEERAQERPRRTPEEYSIASDCEPMAAASAANPLNFPF